MVSKNQSAEKESNVKNSKWRPFRQKFKFVLKSVKMYMVCIYAES